MSLFNVELPHEDHRVSIAVRHGVRFEVVVVLSCVLPIDLVRHIDRFVDFENEWVRRNSNRLALAVCFASIPCSRRVADFYAEDIEQVMRDRRSEYWNTWCRMIRLTSSQSSVNRIYALLNADFDGDEMNHTINGPPRPLLRQSGP